MLIDNKRILQSKNKQLVQKLEQYENRFCEVSDAKTGISTLIVTKGDQKIFYHSRYNPMQEAKAILSNQLNEEIEYVLLIGVGLGYVVQELIEQRSDVRFSIYEPNLDVLSCFLNTFNLSKVRSKNFEQLFSHPSELTNLNKLYNDLAEDRAQIIISPIANTLYANEIKQFIGGFKNYLTSYKDSTITDLRFQARWTINSIVNFAEILKSPNFFKHIDLKKLENKPVLIVAAGPSLNDEIENIRLIKEQGKAYIFAVGSAINTLIKNHILPDALFSYDPTPKNAEVVKRVKELELDIPLIFGSSIGFEVLKNYPGKKVHFFTSQDSINSNLINHNSHVIIPDAPTIAAIALYIVGGIKMGPVMLVGQNLSITKEKTYADGIDYIDDADVTEDKLKAYKVATSTTGDEIYTGSGYLSMRDVIQFYIKQVGLEKNVFNTTKNGLPIEGAPFVPLESLLETHLQENNIVDSSIFDVENDYNIEDTLNRFKQYENYFDALIEDFKKLVAVDKQIQEAYSKKLINNTQSYFNEFDKYFNRIEKNPFFLQTLAPITRTQYKQLVDKSDGVRFEKRPLKKMEKYINVYSKYIRTMYVGIVQIQPAFGELKKSDLFKKEDA
ncbi:motility associated factor glycosyltransferase family protein [Metasolibacillus fluoroglycofenilyticus]|uniref:motility associated factor glycosyltransferase family protein n=1 Tax=Metasolibacillus fluoroglycofenilyticus TaxID=1239396 RepID=UPI000D3538F8|nr:6-hydroxymethylpterin diphosphokinase MptE-like protein [Metasolibacillus fluoroglycofenilyticus]